MRRRRAPVLALAAATVAAALACTPGPDESVAPATTSTTAASGSTSTCTTSNQDSVDSFAPAGITTEEAVAETIHQDRLVVGVSSDTALISSRNQDRELEGFDVDIAREVARDLFGSPDRIELKVLTVPQRIPALVDDQVDLTVNSLTVTCGRWEQINFSTEYLRAGQKLLVNRDDAAAGIDTLDELAGRRVCASRSGTGMANLRENHPDIVPVGVDERADCLVHFQQGTTDAILNGDNLLAGFVDQDPWAVIVGDYVEGSDGPAIEPTAIGVKKEHVALTRFVNRSLERIRADGTWQQIYDRWLRPVLGEPETGFAPPPAVYGRQP